MTGLERLALAERQLDRLAAFFPRVDGKVNALFAVASAELAITLLNLEFGDLQKWFVTVPVVCTILALCIVFVALYRCMYPHTEGGSGSLIYFGEIASKTEHVYMRAYASADIDLLYSDFSAQIWRNSEILKLKFTHLRTASVCLVASLLPFSLALLASSLLHTQLPKVG